MDPVSVVLGAAPKALDVAMIPAMRAVERTSPLGALPLRIASRASDDIVIRPLATARRWVAGLEPTSTKYAAPVTSR